MKIISQTWNPAKHNISQKKNLLNQVKEINEKSSFLKSILLVRQAMNGTSVVMQEISNARIKRNESYLPRIKQTQSGMFKTIKKAFNRRIVIEKRMSRRVVSFDFISGCLGLYLCCGLLFKTKFTFMKLKFKWLYLANAWRAFQISMIKIIDIRLMKKKGSNVELKRFSQDMILY